MTRIGRAAWDRGPSMGKASTNPPLNVIEDGVLTTWLLDTATAAELELVTNGRAKRGGASPSPGTSNFTLSPGSISADDLIAGVTYGVYVTDLIGHGVNMVTGDYSRGAAGFVIRNGQLEEPVSEITIAGNLRDMFQALTPADDLQFRYATNAPTIAIEGMTIAGA